jgi:hypothetical protein
LGPTFKKKKEFQDFWKLLQQDKEKDRRQQSNPYLHAMLYHYMDAGVKQYLCPQNSHPAYCIPQARYDWNVSSKTWKDYTANIFKEPAFGSDFPPVSISLLSWV